MMKVELKNCFLEEEHDHEIPYLETYQWDDGSTSELPACCVNSDLGIDEFPSSIKKLIRVATNNTDSQMLSSIWSTDLMEVDKGLFFISTGDIDEAPTTCYFIKGTIGEALTEYLTYDSHLEIPFMQIFSALNKGILDKNFLSENWVPAGIFSANPDLEGLQISVKTTGLNSELDDLINNTGLDMARAELWQKLLKVQ
jgi:hypothetical protein